MIREIDRTYLKPPDRGVPPPRSGQPPLEVLTGLEHGSPGIDAGLHEPGWMLGRSDLGNERRRHPADHFSLRIEPVCPEELSHPLAMNGIEPQALRDQVARASGTDVAIIAPQPDCVLLTLPQLYVEVR